MKQSIKDKIQMIIDKWVNNYNKLMEDDPHGFEHIAETEESLGIMIHMDGDDNCIAIDGELLAQHTCTSEFQYLKTLWDDIYDVLCDHEYEYYGMGLFKQDND